MARWFRLYSEALNDPKVQRLDGDTFKFWVNVLCLASENDGRLPDLPDMAFALRMEQNACLTVVERLLNGGLIDRTNGGPNGWHYAPHGWSKRQYKSDGSTERVKRFRERSKPVSETPPDTDTDTDYTVPKGTDAIASPDKVFWANAKAYLGGNNPGALIGKWCRDYGKGDTKKALTVAQIEQAVDPVAFVERILRKAKRESEEHVYEGP